MKGREGTVKVIYIVWQENVTFSPWKKTKIARKQMSLVWGEKEKKWNKKHILMRHLQIVLHTAIHIIAVFYQGTQCRCIVSSAYIFFGETFHAFHLRLGFHMGVAKLQMNTRWQWRDIYHFSSLLPTCVNSLLCPFVSFYIPDIFNLSSSEQRPGYFLSYPIRNFSCHFIFSLQTGASPF